MARFLLQPGCGAAELLYQVIHSLPKEQQSVSIFKKSQDLYLILRNIAHNYRNDIPDYYNRLRQLRHLKIYFHRTVTREDEVSRIQAEVFFDPPEMHLFRLYFNSSRNERVSVLEHELTHMLQSLFEPKRKRALAKKREDEEGVTIKYEHDYYEEETLSKDIYHEIMHKRKWGRLRSESAVANYIRNHEDFIEFKSSTKKRKFKKIMTYVFANKIRKNIEKVPTMPLRKRDR